MRGVDLAVRRRIKWLIGGARRGEGVKRSALPLSWFLCLSLPLSPSLGQEKRPLGLNKQITWPSNTTHHCCTGTSFRQHFTGLRSVLIPTSKDAHTVRTHTHMHANIHTAESPHQHDSGFTSPHSVRSLIPRVALEQHQQCEQREKGERGTIQLLNCCCSALQAELSIKLIKKVVKVVTVL